MSDRSKNLLATVAVIGIAAMASTQGLTSKPAPQQVAAVAPAIPVTFNR